MTEWEVCGDGGDCGGCEVGGDCVDGSGGVVGRRGLMVLCEDVVYGCLWRNRYMCRMVER